MAMTILQGLKKIKHLDRKVKRNQDRIARWCSYLSDEDPMYDANGIQKLIQATYDLITERNNIRHALHRTNILVKPEFQWKEMSLDELIILRTLTLPSKIATMKLLRRQEKNYLHDKGVKVVIQYDPGRRDKEIDSMENLMDELDSLLDEMNIKTELIG